MSCTTHHENLTIGILAGRHPKNIYSMITFEFANTVANSTEVQGGDECKVASHVFEKGSND